MAYIYQADIYCNDCGRTICRLLEHQGKAPANPRDEYSYDSDFYPKHCGDDEEADTPEHCARGEKCLNAIELPSGDKVGFLFGELTTDGVQYVKDSLAEAKEGLGSLEVVELWVEHFRDKGYDL